MTQVLFIRDFRGIRVQQAMVTGVDYQSS